MARAFLDIRDAPHYRRDSFSLGLVNAGYSVYGGSTTKPEKTDIYVIWNRYAHFDEQAKLFEQVGAKVLVAENCYLGNKHNGSIYYSLALTGHNGSGNWYVGIKNRFETQKRLLLPWKTDGEEIVLLPQRGIGPKGVAMPQYWTSRTLANIKELTNRPVRVRDHPGTNKDVISLEEDLKNAYCVVTWASGAALKAICMGVPCFHGLDCWIGKSASNLYEQGIDYRYMGDRTELCYDIGWCSWSLEEIERGIPFQTLLGTSEN